MSLASEYVYEPDEHDLAYAVAQLTKGETITVGSRRFVADIRAVAPFAVDATWIENDIFTLERRG